MGAAGDDFVHYHAQTDSSPFSNQPALKTNDLAALALNSFMQQTRTY